MGELLTAYGTGLLVVGVVVALWVAVQNGWRRVFADADTDVLAARRCEEEQGCHVCGCVSGEIEP